MSTQRFNVLLNEIINVEKQGIDLTKENYFNKIDVNKYKSSIDNTMVYNDAYNKSLLLDKQDKIKQDALGVDKGTITENGFQNKWGVSTHRYKYDTDINYKKQIDERLKTESPQGKIDYPSTSLMNKKTINPNAAFMYPNLSSEGHRSMSDFSNEVILSAMPIPGIDKVNKVSKTTKILSNTDDVIKNVSRQLDEPPLEVVFDDMLSNSNTTINLGRGSNASKIKKQVPYEKIDLGNDLVLYNNASRQLKDESILGTNRAIKSIKNTKTNEYIDLKSWKDGDDLYYYFSANMPSSKIKAGKSYIELEKFIPKNAQILEQSSISMDSFNNILKQLKNPKFESSVKGKINLNNMSVHNKVPFYEKQSALKTQNNVLFDSINDANLAVGELNKLMTTHGLPEASAVAHTVDGRTVFSIEIPNIALKKLYTILGISGTAKVAESQYNK